jgi:hypothetical protein
MTRPLVQAMPKQSNRQQNCQPLLEEMGFDPRGFHSQATTNAAVVYTVKYKPADRQRPLKKQLYDSRY